MTDSEITISILREIRDSIRTLDSNLSTRMDGLDFRLDKLTARVDVLTDRVSLVETTVKDMAGQLVMIARYLKNRTEVAITDLQERVAKLEVKVG